MPWKTEAKEFWMNELSSFPFLRLFACALRERLWKWALASSSMARNHKQDGKPKHQEQFSLSHQDAVSCHCLLWYIQHISVNLTEFIFNLLGRNVKVWSTWQKLVRTALTEHRNSEINLSAKYLWRARKIAVPRRTHMFSKKMDVTWLCNGLSNWTSLLLGWC